MYHMKGKEYTFDLTNILRSTKRAIRKSKSSEARSHYNSVTPHDRDRVPRVPYSFLIRIVK